MYYVSYLTISNRCYQSHPFSGKSNGNLLGILITMYIVQCRYGVPYVVTIHSES